MGLHQYDDPRFWTRQLMPIGDSTGISVAGTAAADSVLMRLRIPRPITVDEATIVALTGGTASAGGPTLAIQQSVAGTGTPATIGSVAFATSANNASFAVTVTSTDFASGDHLLLTNLAGTSASSPKVNLMIGWKETFVS